MSTMQLLLEPVAQDLELPLVSLRLDLRQLVSQNCSQLDHIPLQLKEESTLHLEICIMMTGDGIFMIQSKEVTGLEIKMQSNI